MTTNKTIKHIFMVLITMLPFFYVAIIWNNVPETIPTHFGIDGKPNAWGTKSDLWLECGIIASIALGVYALMYNIHKIDPKRAVQGSSPMFGKVATGLVFFMTALNIIVITSETSNAKVVDVAMMPLLGLLFAFLGNMMHNIKPNYFFGIRIPWTLNSDENWRKTHQLAGKLWFAGGLIIVLASFLLKAAVMHYFMLTTVAVITLIPVGYSFLYFRKEQKMEKIEQ